MSNQPELGTRVLLALRQRLFGDALATALTCMGVEAAVADRRDLESLGSCATPRTIVLDVDGGHQLDALAGPADGARVIVLASDVDDSLVAQVLARGGRGVVSLDASLEDLREAIEAVGHGSTAVRGVGLKQLFRGTSLTSVNTHGGTPTLTVREASILARLAQGASTREVAAELGITTNTARTHIQNILGKLNVHSTLEASALATRLGLV